MDYMVQYNIVTLLRKYSICYITMMPILECVLYSNIHMFNEIFYPYFTNPLPFIPIFVRFILFVFTLL